MRLKVSPELLNVDMHLKVWLLANDEVIDEVTAAGLKGLQCNFDHEENSSSEWEVSVLRCRSHRGEIGSSEAAVPI